MLAMLVWCLCLVGWVELPTKSLGRNKGSKLEEKSFSGVRQVVVFLLRSWLHVARGVNLSFFSSFLLSRTHWATQVLS